MHGIPLNCAHITVSRSQEQQKQQQQQQSQEYNISLSSEGPWIGACFFVSI